MPGSGHYVTKDAAGNIISESTVIADPVNPLNMLFGFIFLLLSSSIPAIILLGINLFIKKKKKKSEIEKMYIQDLK